MAIQRNVLIVGGYARQNAGDAALLHAIILQMERVFPGCRVEIAGMEDPRRHRDFEGVRNLGSMRRYADDECISRFRRAARRALVLAIGMSWFVAPTRWYRWLSAWLPTEVSAELAAIERADLLVSLVVAGGYLQGAARPGLGPRVIYQLLPLILAERLGTPVVCAPQSYGPFDGKLVPWIVAKTLRRARLVLAREDISLAELAKLRLPAGVARRAVDSAFSLDPPGPVPGRPARMAGITRRRRGRCPGRRHGPPLPAVRAAGIPRSGACGVRGPGPRSPRSPCGDLPDGHRR